VTHKIRSKDIRLSKFPSGWETKILAEVCHRFLNGGTPSTQKSEYWNGSIPWISGADIRDQRIVDVRKFISETAIRESSTNLIPEGNLLLVTRTGVGKATINRFDVTISQDITGLILDSNLIDTEFAFHFFDANENKLKSLNQGTSINGITRDVLQSLEIPLPPLPEQKEIVKVLNYFNTRLHQAQQLVIQKELYKKWLMHSLLTGKKRVKGFSKSQQFHRTEVGILPSEWKLIPLKNVVSSVKKPVIPETNGLYQEIGIRSHAKGLFHKESVTGKSLGEKSVFWVEPDCLVVNIVFAWEHAIAKTTVNEIGMIASHRFPMFKPKPGVLDLDYLLYFFKSLRGKHLLGLASPGGAGRNKTLGQTEFLKLEIPVPSFEEQVAIVRILNAADREIELLKAKTGKLREQKKGMMQALLTGKKRLKYKL
jgi:restriction endonuclease S subunit